ncbi:putative membrane protein [Nocardia phage NBR1]|uniref:hypothetical protein n=1 Tax=Nocardia phage NBR1 TaxID=1109711 RepID=UPI00023EEDE9|nr:hypothetical protein NoPhNBR1_gp38 [Nocardia phage NBR1]AEV52251.1 putative membrane protein [Nocardia phage NBR1]
MNRAVVLLVGALAASWALLEDDERLPGNAFFLAFTGLVAVFIALYAARSPWRSTEMGRALMYMMCACLLVGVTVSLTLVFGPNYPGRFDVRNVMMLGASLTVLNMVMIVYRLQQETRRLAAYAAYAADWAEHRPGTAPPP